MPQPSDASHRGFSMRAEGSRAEILLYDVIDPWYGISAKQFHEQLKALGDVSTIDLRINSPGGSITEGMAIHSILKRQSAKVVGHVDGVAGSMASVVLMAGDEIEMAQGSYLMIHNPLAMAAGEADEMRAMAELLDKMKAQLVNIYAARTKQSPEAISSLMDAETWFTPEEAIAAGFADRTSAQVALACSIDPNRFFHTPQKLRGEVPMTDTSTKTTAPDAAAAAAAQPQPASYDELKAECLGADAAFLCAQLDRRATAAQARTAWMTEQQTRLAAAEKEAEAAKAKAAAEKTGVEPLGNRAGKGADAGGGDAIARFNDAVQAKLTAGRSRAQAVAQVIAENEDLHQEYLEAYNAMHGRPGRVMK